MAFDVSAMNNEMVICHRCGTAFGKRKGNFPVCYGESYRGVGHLHICKGCLDALYEEYYALCESKRHAVRQVCRKLDLYWNERIFNAVEAQNTNRTIMTQYLQKINSVNQSGKSYDTTLMEEGMMWDFGSYSAPLPERAQVSAPEKEEETIPPKLVAFWGPGYSAEQYKDLDTRLKYWKSRLPKGVEFDIGTETIIKQICAVEIDINTRRAANQAVDKQIASLNTLLGSANLKPVQKKQDELDAGINGTPLGVWIYRYENQKPLPEIDDDLKDVNGIKKYVFTWMGHLCKMLGIKNDYTKLYEDAIRKYSVEKPEYDGDDDEFWFGGDAAYDDD